MMYITMKWLYSSRLCIYVHMIFNFNFLFLFWYYAYKIIYTIYKK